MADAPLSRGTRQLKTLYNALADRVLEPHDPAYVPQVNAGGASDAVEEIATEIEWQDGFLTAAPPSRRWNSSAMKMI